jgi:hypothetical protein
MFLFSIGSPPVKLRVASEKLSGSVQEIAAHDSILYLCTCSDTVIAEYIVPLSEENTSMKEVIIPLQGTVSFTAP